MEVVAAFGAVADARQFAAAADGTEGQEGEDGKEEGEVGEGHTKESSRNNPSMDKPANPKRIVYREVEDAKRQAKVLAGCIRFPRQIAPMILAHGEIVVSREMKSADEAP